MDLFDLANARAERDARQARDNGMIEAEFAETLTGSSFSDEALNAIRRVARRQETLFVDDIIAECRVEPLHYNAWGAVWMRAIRQGIIEPTKERRQSRDLKKHAHEYKVYRSCIYLTARERNRERIAAIAHPERGVRS